MASQSRLALLSNIVVSLSNRPFGRANAAKYVFIAIQAAHHHREILCLVIEGTPGGIASYKRGTTRRRRLEGTQLRVQFGSIRRRVNGATYLVDDDISMPRFRRRQLLGAVHRSDGERQYSDHELHALLSQTGMTGSIKGKANCRHNAPTKISPSGLKNEGIHGTRYETCKSARADSFEYIALF